MPFVELSLDSLSELDDGRVAKAFQHELKRAVQDCIDRPGDKKPRAVTLELSLTPITVNNDGMVETEGCDGEFQIRSKVPTRKSKTYSFRANKKGHLAYSSNSPESVDQTTFDDINPVTGRVDRSES
ncbi:MAG: hypothetical protein IT422_00680 [Pirellulaceae bacterium]|nr:hypothetical protein [Pirellulaceae bacterium]